MNRKRGRPEKYPDDIIRTETRKNQNRINQQHHRALIKLRSDVATMNKLKNTEQKKLLIQPFNKVKYDLFFTATISPIAIERITLLKEINKSPLNELIKFTKTYIEHIFKKQGVINCFGVIVKGENGTYHVNLLIKTKQNITQFEKFTKNYWLTNDPLTILIENNQENVLFYCMKNLSSVDNIINW